MSSPQASHRMALWAAAAFLVLWSAAGIYDNSRFACSQGLYDPSFRVPQLPASNIGAKAGLRAGDRVVSVEGFPIASLGMESRWPRALTPRPGESRRFLVERNGAMLLVNVLYEPVPSCLVHFWIAAAALGFAFLACGLWALFSAGDAPARTLAAIGFATAATTAFALGPNLGWWRAFQCNASTAAAALIPLIAFHFFLLFPRPKRLASSRPLLWLYAAACAGLLAFLAAEIVLHPALYYATGSVLLPWCALLAFLTLVAIIHTLFTTPRATIRASGLLLIFAGWLVLLAISILRSTPLLRLPDWAGLLSIAVLPLAMAMAVKQNIARTTPREAS